MSIIHSAIPLQIFVALLSASGAFGAELTETYVIIDLSEGPNSTNYPITELASAPEDITSDIYKTDHIVLRRIPAGSFMRGSPENEAKREADREQQHRVTLTQDFYIGVFQVTQAQWLNVMGGDNPSYFTGDPTRPVEQVSWHNVQKFLQHLNKRTPGLQASLPTEAQWEYAARGGTVGPTYGPLNAIAWHDGNSNQTTQPVGGKQANAWGLYDMIGNVSEWCADWFDAYPRTAVTDPTGPDSGSDRVFRGGAWSGADNCRAAFRGTNVPELQTNYVGFRLFAHAPGQPRSAPPVLELQLNALSEQIRHVQRLAGEALENDTIEDLQEAIRAFRDAQTSIRWIVDYPPPGSGMEKLEHLVRRAGWYDTQTQYKNIRNRLMVLMRRER